jgi:hypothetical protein
VLLDTFQAADRTRLARATLAKLRVTGGGPPFVKLGAKVLYDSADLESWIAAQGKRRSTSAPVSDAPDFARDAVNDATWK